MANQYNYVALDPKGKIVAYVLTKWEAKQAAARVGGSWRAQKPPELEAQMKSRGTWSDERHGVSAETERPRRYLERRLTRPDLSGRVLSPEIKIVVPKDVPEAPPYVPEEVVQAQEELEQVQVEPTFQSGVTEEVYGEVEPPVVVVPASAPEEPPHVSEKKIEQIKVEVEQAQEIEQVQGVIPPDGLPHNAVGSAAEIEPERDYNIHEVFNGVWRLQSGPFSGAEFLPGEVLYDYFALPGYAVVPVDVARMQGPGVETWDLDQPVRSAADVEPDASYHMWGKDSNVEGGWTSAKNVIPGTSLLPGGSLHFMLPNDRTRVWKTCYVKVGGDPNRSGIQHGDPFTVEVKPVPKPQLPPKIELPGKTMICDCCHGLTHDDRPCEVCGLTQYTIKCKTCDGKGHVSGTRPGQEGTGEPQECPSCKGKAVQDCPSCVGVGFVEKGSEIEDCKTCNTKGQIDCETCGGLGVVEPPKPKAKTVTTTCPDCEGHKKVAIPEDALLAAGCKECDTTGKVDGRACPVCDGLGIDERELKRKFATLEPCDVCKDAKCPCCVGAGVLLLSGEPLDRVRKKWDAEQAGQYRTWRQAQARART